MRSALCTFVVSVLALSWLSSCGGGDDPVRVGILTDCSGILAPTRELALAAASLPLVERGAQPGAGGWVESADVSGRVVEIVPACTEVTYLHLLVFATRRLVEEEDVDVVIGPIGDSEAIVFRELASRYPEVTFVAGPAQAQAATLRKAPPNHYRFTPDGPQRTAGLGAYAFDELGWRRAVVVAEGFPAGWEPVAGFVAEFCALGGEVVERDWVSWAVPDPSDAVRRHLAEADGVLLVSNVGTPLPYLGAATRLVPTLAPRMLLAGGAFGSPQNWSAPGLDLSSVVLASPTPLHPGARSMQRLRDRFARAFPGVPSGTSEDWIVAPLYTSMEAVMSALEATSGELGVGQATFRRALDASALGTPYGVVRLDDDRQAVVPIFLERIVKDERGQVTTRGVRVVASVEHTFGGIFSARTHSPSATEPACVKRQAPPWAR